MCTTEKKTICVGCLCVSWSMKFGPMTTIEYGIIKKTYGQDYYSFYTVGFKTLLDGWLYFLVVLALQINFVRILHSHLLLTFFCSSFGHNDQYEEEEGKKRVKGFGTTLLYGQTIHKC